MKNLYRNLGDMEFDGLITDVTPEPIVRGGTIKRLGTAGTLKRGTIMEKGSDGLLYVLGSNPAGEVTEDFNGTGAATTFTLNANPLPLSVKSAKVGTADATISAYNAQTGVVTLSSAPTSGTKNVHITYDNPAPAVPDCVLCDDTDVGTSAEVTASVYVAGCFDPAKCTVAEDYTLSASDKDALRTRGILFKAAAAAN